VLQVTRDAEPEVIERAYKALARKYHPDRASADPVTAKRTMQRINEAYGILGDPLKRARYDATLASATGPNGAPHGWDVFLERGLVGLFLDRYRSRRR